MFLKIDLVIQFYYRKVSYRSMSKCIKIYVQVYSIIHILEILKKKKKRPSASQQEIKC